MLYNVTPSLQYLDLSYNNIDGTLEMLEPMRHLQILRATGNSFYGGIAFCGTISKFGRLNLAGNRLAGVPRYFLSTERLSKLNLSGKHFHGSLPLQDLLLKLRRLGHDL